VLSEDPKPAPTKSETRKERPGCGSLQEELEEFLDVKGLILPEECYEPGDAPRKELQPDVIERSSQIKFVIATLPDPAHTHLPVLFDQFAVAIQEGAQDEKLRFRWFLAPWEDGEPSYALLSERNVQSREGNEGESARNYSFSEDYRLRREREQPADCREIRVRRIRRAELYCHKVIARVW